VVPRVCGWGVRRQRHPQGRGELRPLRTALSPALRAASSRWARPMRSATSGWNSSIPSTRTDP
jgi:hypothetical protein